MDQAAKLMAVVVAASPITLAVVQGLKAAGITGSRWAMPAAIVVGEGICFLVAAAHLVAGFALWGDWGLAALAGVATGLSAAGLYSGGQKVVGAGSGDNSDG
jgi:hypothetical protein